MGAIDHDRIAVEHVVTSTNSFTAKPAMAPSVVLPARAGCGLL